jgi:hypothetical protein
VLTLKLGICSLTHIWLKINLLNKKSAKQQVGIFVSADDIIEIQVGI